MYFSSDRLSVSASMLILVDGSALILIYKKKKCHSRKGREEDRERVMCYFDSDEMVEVSHRRAELFRVLDQLRDEHLELGEHPRVVPEQIRMQLNHLLDNRNE